MKKVIALVVFFLMVPAIGQTAGFSVSEVVTTSGGETSLSSEVLLYQGFEGTQFGLSGFIQVGEGWSQFLVGPTWSPTPWLTVGQKIGLTDGENKPRYASSVFASKGKLSLFCVYEYGQGGTFHKQELTWKPNAWLSLGAVNKKFAGAGPKIWIQVPKLPVSVYGAYFIKNGTETQVLGVTFSF